MGALFVHSPDLALNEAVRTAVFTVIGGEDDDGVVDDALRQLVELTEEVANLVIEDLGDLGVAVEAALPVRERRVADAVAGGPLGPDGVRNDLESLLRLVSCNSSPDGFLKKLNVGMGGGFSGCGIVDGVLPVGRKVGVAEGGWGFERVGVPVDDGRSGRIVDELAELGVWVVLVVVREEVGEGEELRSGGEELAVVRVDVADGQAPWGIGGLDVLQISDGLAGGVGVVVVWGGTVGFGGGGGGMGSP